MLKGNALINAIFTYLEDEGYWRKTSSILLGIGEEVNDKTVNNARITLNYLVGRGEVERRGSGKFEWRFVPAVERKHREAPHKPIPPERVNTPTEEEIEAPGATEEAPEPAPVGSAVLNQQQQEQMDKLKQRIDSFEDNLINLQKLGIVHTDILVELRKEITSLREEVGATKTIEIKQHKKPVVKVEGPTPEVFDKVLDLAICRMNILLTGPAGCGKTTIAELISKALSLQFGAVVCTAGMSESHLLGRELQNLSDGSSKFRGTDFVTCYEQGGVYLLDELDAADPNVLLCVNTALSNGYVNLPGRAKKSKAIKHEDFVCIATANTFGRGANRQYAGRNQLDESTIDRFRIGQVEVNYDRKIERSLCPDEEILNACWKIREGIEAAGLRRIMSTRFIADAYKMRFNLKWKLNVIMEGFFAGWTSEEIKKVKPDFIR